MKIGRNDPCHCGSGQKYKKCHLPADEAAERAAKAAADHLARVWAEELRGRGVRFLSVDPGEMDTQMHADALPDADRATLARPEDVARRVADALADAARFPSGVRFAAQEVP